MKTKKVSASKNPSKIKDYGPLAGLLVLAVIIEIFREVTGIPVCILDIMFFSALIFIAFYLLYYRFFKKNKKKKSKNKNFEHDETYSLQKTAGHIVVFIFIIALGLWSSWQGFYHPFKYYTGVRGNAHGYTLFAMGLVFAGIGFWGMRKSIRSCRNKK